MRKIKRRMTYAAKKRRYARNIVRLCMAIAGKHMSAERAVEIADHILTHLPAPLMRRLVAGDWRRPMREAMKLTASFIVERPCA